MKKRNAPSRRVASLWRNEREPTALPLPQLSCAVANIEKAGAKVWGIAKLDWHAPLVNAEAEYLHRLEADLAFAAPDAAEPTMNAGIDGALDRPRLQTFDPEGGEHMRGVSPLQDQLEMAFLRIGQAIDQLATDRSLAGISGQIM